MVPPSSLREKKLHAKGFKLIAGVDEAGRGPLAGPVVAAAVIFPRGTRIKGLNDSKKLSAQKRAELFFEIKDKAFAIGVGVVSHKLIDRINIGQANLLAMKKAVLNLPIMPNYLLIDGGRYKVDLDIPQEGITGGDRKVPSIAAASIIAKVTRDRMMLRLHNKFPQYRFDSHKGYGTKLHYRRLKEFGPCAIHRRSFCLTK
ncbi:ribonuclease HII [Candidatus Margulisiibacteriota bacterium]